MAVTVETTPNPRAMKFKVGGPVGDTATYTSSDVADQGDVDARISPLFGIDGVMSVFMTADFVTLTRTDEASWDNIVPEAVAILESSFG